ncbi:uncharacterized protein KD926_007689 [Aspergillus affinis]|uniref:uncharacterized protein n=1 Tax=Aspergillus affinis TaxID=1070780 RepID=UPI0022FF1771|nr:uncharacterized protein KD926_007689 [Aspergillus affinis]KAI9040747.1 hypothetical protein KD926_007689 [Aspergillus affinis]
MLFRTSLLCIAASLVCAPLAAALPTEARSDMTLTPRDGTQCAAGTKFYVCSLNDFRGCCSVDPCALKEGCPDNKNGDNKPKKPGNNPPINACPAPNTDSKPKPDISSPPPKEAPSCPPPGKKAKIFQPHTETLLEGSSPIPTSNLNVSKTSTTDQQQTIHWTLPANAKACVIGWSIPEQEKRKNFQAGSKSSVNVYAGADKNNNKKLGDGNFAFWPEKPAARTNLVAVVECKEDMLFRLQMAHEDASVFLEQNAETGWWVEYEC